METSMVKFCIWVTSFDIMLSSWKENEIDQVDVYCGNLHTSKRQ